MPQIYAARRRIEPSAPVVQNTMEPGRQTQPSAVRLDELGRSDLEQQMQMRIQQHFLEHQIPQAEQEADRLSAGMEDARTPEEVKSRLGEKLGADFSGVRFHTGAGAVETADHMGARAYATGRDIYFGEGGFDPGVAAHELVHTVQQGLVESAAPTVSAPAGQVQMLPFGLGKMRHRKKYFPAFGARNEMVQQTLDMRNQQRDAAEAYAIQTGAMSQPTSENDRINSKTGGRTYLALFQQGDSDEAKAYNETLNKLVSPEHGLRDDISYEEMSDGFERLATPIYRELMNLNLGEDITSEEAVRKHYLKVQDLTSRMNSLTDLRNQVANRMWDQDHPMNPNASLKEQTEAYKDRKPGVQTYSQGIKKNILGKMGIRSTDALDNRMEALGRAKISMQHSMGVGRAMHEVDLTSGPDAGINAEYDKGQKKKWWQFWK